MSEKILTNSYSKSAALQFINLISSGERYYVFASRFLPYANSDVVEIPIDSQDYKNDVYSSMIFGKLITEEDVNLVIEKNEWTSNTVYDQYDSQISLIDKTYYSIVNAGSWSHVYKCLYNNNGMPSIVQPDFSSVSVGDRFFETSDGYLWKYMYSAPASLIDDFGTEKYFPVFSNSSVSDIAVSGSIDTILVEGRGNNYSNYLIGNNHFSSGDMRIGGNSVLYSIVGNSVASSTNNFYNGCMIYIKSGPANEVGQYKKIVNYFVNSTAKVIVLESAFANALSISSAFEIYPGVSITSDGLQTSNAVARAIVNAVSNNIHRIEVLNSGSGYKIANASVFSYVGVGATDATLRVVASPKYGHGYDPGSELGATKLMLNAKFQTSESNTIPTSNDYRTIGILKNPMFANVLITTANKQGNFLNGEKLFKVKPVLLGNTMTTNSSSSILTDVNGSFNSIFANGDYVYVASGNNNMVAQISAITNSSSMILESNALFTASGASYYLPRNSTSAIVISSSVSTLNLTNVDGKLESTDCLIGLSSGTKATINTISIGGIIKGFDTFINTYKYVGTITSGTFIEDETVYQDSISTANGKFHSIENGYLYTDGSFSVGKSLVGSNSAAIALLSTKYEPELVFNSGSILYMENLDPIPRSNSQTETFKLTLEF